LSDTHIAELSKTQLLVCTWLMFIAHDNSLYHLGLWWHQDHDFMWPTAQKGCVPL